VTAVKCKVSEIILKESIDLLRSDIAELNSKILFKIGSVCF